MCVVWKIFGEIDFGCLIVVFFFKFNDGLSMPLFRYFVKLNCDGMSF